ncbi:MAG: hypothetical protein MJZ16_08865 [Bacteroidales bacterium]|nr:hypothetical protein [Bacteroidales bacterium]
MSAFVIYAIILTLVYIVYYSAMVTREMYARKDQVSDTTETFDVGGMNDQIESVAVNESKNGFYLGDTVAEEEDQVNEENITDVVDEDQVSVLGTGQASDEPSEAELYAESAEAMMEDIEPEFPAQYEPDEFDLILLNPSNTVPVIITTDTRDEL